MELILFVTRQQNKELALKASFVILTSANTNRQTKAALLFLKAWLTMAWSYFIWNTKETIEPKRECLQGGIKADYAPCIKKLPLVINDVMHVLTSAKRKWARGISYQGSTNFVKYRLLICCAKYLSLTASKSNGEM